LKLFLVLKILLYIDFAVLANVGIVRVCQGAGLNEDTYFLLFVPLGWLWQA